MTPPTQVQEYQSHNITLKPYKVINPLKNNLLFNDTLESEWDYLNKGIDFQDLTTLLEKYDIINSDKVYNFFVCNDCLVDLFQLINLILEDYFGGGVYVLRIIDNQEYDESKLGLIVKLDYSKYSPKEIVSKLMDFNRAIRPLKRELNLTNKFFADVACL